VGLLVSHDQYKNDDVNGASSAKGRVLLVSLRNGAIEDLSSVGKRLEGLLFPTVLHPILNQPNSSGVWLHLAHRSPNMPRRKSTNPAPTPKAKSHKRALSSSATVTPTPTVAATTSSTPGSRASKRLKESATSSPSTGKKSKYFEGPGSDEEEEEEEEEEDDDDDDDDKAPSPDEEGSDFNGADEDDSAAEPSSASPSPSASEDEDDYESDEDRKKPKKKQQQRGQKSSRRTTAAESGAVATAAGIADKAIIANKELWREGVKTGLGPGKQVFIERPKPRGDGGIKYVPGRIHPNTMAFLADLKQNNDREWLKCECSFLASAWLGR
jgi:hypothetical protein